MTENKLMPQQTPLPRRTPLYDRHAAAGGQLVPFAGWEMPLHYGSQLREHLATRSDCGLFDVSHMGQVEVRGPNAAALVQAMVTRDVAPMVNGDVVYTLLCRDDGGIMDDLMVGRLCRERFMLVVNAATYAKDVARMREIAAGAGLQGAELLPCAERWAMLAVQGPRWSDVCEAVLGNGLWLEMPPMKILTLERNDEELIFSSTGYTGESGFELLCPPQQAPHLWDLFVRAGATPVGLAARDSLRMEKGFALSGQDITEETNPFEAGLAWVVDMRKEHFAGKQALEALKAAGIGRRFVGLLPQGRRIARHGAKILAGGREVGEVTSGGYSPSLDRPIGLGYVEAEFSGPGTDVELDLGRGTIPAKVTGRRMVS